MASDAPTPTNSAATPTRAAHRPHVAVCGGGISGLLAAWRIATARPAVTVSVFEAADYWGGKLYTRDCARGPVDVGAEAFVIRRPEALNLVAELGVDAWLRAPAGRRPAVFSQGALHSLPAAQVFGIPASTEGLTGLLSADVIHTIDTEPQRPGPWTPGQDALVGELVARQLGREVTDRLVDPMLGGVYAASADELGLRAVAPELARQLDAQAAERGHASVVAAARAVRATAVSGQVFATLDGGYRRLVEALVAACRAAGVQLYRQSRVLAVRAGAGAGAVGGHVLVDVPGTHHRTYSVDAAVIALPASAAATVLRPLAPAPAAELAQVRCSSSAVVTLELAAGQEVPELSGVLVAADAGRAAKAITFSSRKWDHVDLREHGRGHVLRVSFGRLRDASALQLDDAALVDSAVAELAVITGVHATVVDAHVQRWIDGLPVPGRDHGPWMARVCEQLDAATLPVVLAGAAINGVGVPACIATAEAAVTRLLARWQD